MADQPTLAHPRAVLGASILGSSVAFIDGSVVNVALPSLAKQLHAGAAELPWAINAYLLPLGALILLGGGAGDHFGRRRLFLIGLALFTAASVLCAAAPTLGLLLAGRAAQGTGAALLMPNSLAILGAAFTGEARGRAIGTWAAVGALAGALGPVIGGWLVDAVGWRAIFLINVPVAAGAAYLAWKYVLETRDKRPGATLDWGGAALATVALALLTWALTVASASRDASVPVLAAAAAGAALFAAFLWIEARRGDRAIMPFALFRTRAFVGLTLFTFLLYGALGGLLVLLPYLLIHVAHWSATSAGAALIPVPILIGLGSRLMGKLAARIGGRVPLGIGAAIAAAGFALFTRVGGGQIDYWRDLLPATLALGVGMGIAVAPLTTTVMASVDTDHIGAASGFNSAVARIAGLVATALLGLVFAVQGSGAAFVGGFRAAALAGAVIAAAASACAFLLIGGKGPEARAG